MKWFESNNPNGFVTGKKFSVDEPCPTVMAAGMAGDSLGHWHIHDDGKPEKPMIANTSKPPYRVPSMEEIRAIPWNGYTVASTFSGAGGSCTGYRMAGFKVAWANEFVPAAQDSYRANAAPGSILDPRDIKLVRPEEILNAIGLQKWQLDIFDGSPPCQAFSTAGKREKGWGKEKKYEGGGQQCNEDLFSEYIRLLRGLMPRVFIAENVSGLIKGKAKGYFLDILKELKASGYKVECQVLDAQWLGVPQRRTRVIFMGVRDDIGLPPAFPKPLQYNYTVREAIPWIDRPGVRAVHDTGGDSPNRWAANVDITDSPCLTITLGIKGLNAYHYKVEGPVDPNVNPTALEPETDITRFAIGQEWDKIKPGEQSEKYFNLVKPSLDEACPSILASHGNTGMAGVVHPTEKRKFTIAEVKRICSFPDDFDLRGTYGQQWERMGNSVPPVMMAAIAKEVRDRILDCVPVTK